MTETTTYACPVCQIGVCHPATATYLQLIDGQLLSAPEMPIWKCDVCHHQEFDGEAVEALENLLGISDSTEASRASLKLTAFDPTETTARRIKP